MNTEIKLPESKLTKSQTKKFRAEYLDEQGDPCVLIAEVRYDDECGNGHNSFAITGELYDRLDHMRGEPSVAHKETGKRLWLGSCGCVHEDIAKHIPELAPFIKWHLVSSDGPMHGVANALYHANDKDCWGLRKGEKRQILQGGDPSKPCWHLVAIDSNGEEVELYTLKNKSSAGPVCPTEKYTVEYRPWYTVGVGKEPNLDAARRCAVWPEAELEDFTKEKLEARLPALMEEFKRDVESLGFVY